MSVRFRSTATNGVLSVPLLFLLSFGMLLVRARNAFSVWPRNSMNDPWALVHRAPLDGISRVISYSAHINVTYVLLAAFLLSLLPATFLLLFRAMNRHYRDWTLGLQSMGLFGALSLLFFQGGRFLWWFLD